MSEGVRYCIAPRCSLCGVEPDWDTLETVDPETGDYILTIQYDPHTCDPEVLADHCRKGDSGDVDEQDLAGLIERASAVGWNEMPGGAISS